MKKKELTKFLFFIYLIVLVWIVLFKLSFSIDNIPSYRAINTRPFHDALNHPIRTREVIDNILIFIPFGIFISIVNYKKNFILNLFLIFLTSLSFEVIQYVFSIGSTDINDLITNTLGGLVGIIFYWILKKVLGHKAVKVINILASTFIGIIIVLGIILYMYNR